jgi:hypothetical protein
VDGDRGRRVRLEKLKADQLITPDEYDKKRAEILKRSELAGPPGTRRRAARR